MYIWLKRKKSKNLAGLLSELCYVCFTGQLYFPFITCFLLPWLQFLPLSTNITQQKLITTAHTAVYILGTASKHLFFTVYGKKKKRKWSKQRQKDRQNEKVKKIMALCKDPGKQTREKQKSEASSKNLTVKMICIHKFWNLSVIRNEAQLHLVQQVTVCSTVITRIRKESTWARKDMERPLLNRKYKEK